MFRHRGRLAHQPIADFTKWGKMRGVTADWTAVGRWLARGLAASMDEVRKAPRARYTILDNAAPASRWKNWPRQLSIPGLTDADRIT